MRASRSPLPWVTEYSIMLKSLISYYFHLKIMLFDFLFPQRSQSAFSLASEDMPGKGLDPASSVTEALWRQQKGHLRKQKERKLSALPSWKSVDRLNETSKYF